MEKVPIRCGVRGRAEIDIERDVAGASFFQLLEQFGMQLPRPRPNPDLFDGWGIDCDQDNVAARFARFPGKTLVS